MDYSPRTFTIPPLTGISQKSVEEHIGLYQGYVKNYNAIAAKIIEYAADSEKNAHALSELVRRKSFEFDGMRLHEYYFEQFEGAPAALDADAPLALAIAREYGSMDRFVAMFKAIGAMRGPGWAILYWDPVGKRFQTGFSGEQHQGHFVTLPIILALDVWEHAYLLDHGALGKGKYLDAFFANLNWGVLAARFGRAQQA